MWKKVAMIIMSVMLAAGFNLLTNAAAVTVDGLTMDVPDSWTETERTESEDGSLRLAYLCGNGYMEVWTVTYDESLSELSYVLLDVAISGIRKIDGYTEVDSSKVNIGGEEAHLTMFTCDGNVGVLASVDTGVSIANFLYMCPLDVEDEISEYAKLLDSATFGQSAENSDDKLYTKYTAGVYKAGNDLPAGEYILFADNGAGYFCVSSDSNQDDIIFNENFKYNSIISINEGEYLNLTRCYAIPFDEKPELNVDGVGMFKVGTHIPAGEYKLEASGGTGYYCIYPDSRQDDIISNDNFDGQNYVTVTDGQYLVLVRCKFAEPPEKPAKTYTDAETIKKVQEALNAEGYDCGAPDGIVGSGTTEQIEKYQTDKGLTVTGTITDEVLESLGF